MLVRRVFQARRAIPDPPVFKAMLESRDLKVFSAKKVILDSPDPKGTQVPQELREKKAKSGPRGISELKVCGVSPETRVTLVLLDPRVIQVLLAPRAISDFRVYKASLGPRATLAIKECPVLLV